MTINQNFNDPTITVPIEDKLKDEYKSILLEDVEPGSILEYKSKKLFRLHLNFF